MQAMCRDELARVLTRQDSIPDLSLDKLANSDFAAQLTAISERQSSALGAWQEEQRAAAQAERVAAEEKRREALALELEKRREHAAEMRAAFHASIGPLREGCEAYLAAYRGIQEINRGHRIIGRPMPRPCVTHGVPLGQQEQEIESQYERIMRFELPNPLGPFGSLPFVRDFDPESYERMQETLDERLTEIEEILAGLTNR